MPGVRLSTTSFVVLGMIAVRGPSTPPTAAPVQTRDVAELKLFFTEVGEPGHVASLAAEQIAQHRGRVAGYEELIARFGADPGAEPRAVTLELGLELEHAALRFWTALADGDLDRLRRARTPPT